MLDLKGYKFAIGATVNTQIELAAAEATRYQRKMFVDYLTALAQGRDHNIPLEITRDWDVLLARLKDAWAKQLGLVPGKEGTITNSRGVKPKPSPEELEKVNAGR